jgi:hypothetical protein
MEAFMNLTADQMKELYEQKLADDALKGSERFQQCVADCTLLIEEKITEISADAIAYEDVIRAIATNAGIALKAKKKKKGAKKGKSTGITRKSGKRNTNGYMLLLNEERRKFALTNRGEPTSKNSNYVLTKAMSVVWKHLKSTGLESNTKVFQVSYQDWNESNPTENCSIYFAHWWRTCADKDAYETNTDWESYFKGIEVPTDLRGKVSKKTGGAVASKKAKKVKKVKKVKKEPKKVVEEPKPKMVEAEILGTKVMVKASPMEHVDLGIGDLSESEDEDSDYSE